MHHLEPHITWLILLDVFASALFAYAVFKMPGSKIKYSYLAFLFISMIYVNLVYIIRFFALDTETANTVSKFIFFVFSMNIILFGTFLLLFFARSSELKNIRYWVFVAVNILFGISAFIPGILVTGINETSQGYNPVYGTLHPIFITCNFLCAIYIFTIVYFAYKKEQNEVIKYQYMILFFTGLVTFFFIGVMNGIVPAITGNSNSSFIGPLGFLIFYMGVMNIIFNEKSLFIKKEFKKFIQQDLFQKPENISTLRLLFAELSSILAKNPERAKARLSFVGQNSEELNLFLLKDDSKLKVEGKIHKGSVPAGWYQGIIDSFSKIYEDNRRMAFTLVRAENLLEEGWLSKKVERLRLQTGLPEKDFHLLENYKKEIQHSLEENRESFGNDILCFSVAFKKVLIQILNYSISNQIVTFAGEAGTGKSLLAHALHFTRKGGQMEEISCQSTPRELLVSTVENFLNQKKAERPPGLLIKHIDYLNPENFVVLEPLLRDFEGKKFVYFTCSIDFLNSIHRIPANIFLGIKQLIASIPPLRDRKEDIFFQTIYNLKKYSDKFGKNYEAISINMMNSLLKQTWTGNTQELTNTIQSLILNGKSPILVETTKPTEITDAPTVSDLSDLTPLELSEREVIIRYLQSNRYNKNRTRIDLGITINTLNAKVEKYKIPLPDSKG